MVKHWIYCCYCIPWVPSFRLICIKAIVEIFSICGGHQRSLDVIRDHQKVKHWICCYYCIPWIPRFRLICIKPQLKHFHFGRSFRSFEVVRGQQNVKHWICCCNCIPGVLSPGAIRTFSHTVQGYQDLSGYQDHRVHSRVIRTKKRPFCFVSAQKTQSKPTHLQGLAKMFLYRFDLIFQTQII